MLIFTHIPKTAGTSLIKNVLCKSVYPKDRDFSVGEGEKFGDYLFGGKKFGKTPKCISGHFPFGIHRCFDTDDYSYFTFLRDPISRWKSHFFYSLQSDNNDVIKRLYKREKNFEDFLQGCFANEVVCNVTTKQLSGLEEPFQLHLTKKHEKTGTYYVPSLCHSRYSYTADDMKWSLKIAKDNIERYYDFIGFQEDYKKDAKRLCKHYKIKYPGSGEKFRRSNKNTEFDELFKDKKIRKQLMKLNYYDLQLYEFAKGLKK